MPFWPIPMPELAYSLPDFGVKLAFAPTEFTQVNHGINRSLLRRAMSLLDPQPGERIADMFCGLGNFSLPIATFGADEVYDQSHAEGFIRLYTLASRIRAMKEQHQAIGGDHTHG